MPRQPTIWPLLPHTAAKHSIFRRHLGAWFPKLAWSGHVQVIDGFAGPGEYTKGEPGSPVIAVDVASTHRANLTTCQIDLLFIEEDARRFSHLEEKISELVLPANIRIKRRQGSFKDVISEVLDDADHMGVTFPPSFVMIDPFGFEGVPMTLIQRISSQPRSEVLISFMYDSVTRWLDDARNASNFDELFGCQDWRSAISIDDPAVRRDFLLNLYIQQLKGHGWTFTRTFEMKDDDNRTEYFLVFATNNIEGLKVMKEAMWKVDPSGRYVYSDATDRRQMTLFALAPDYEQLKNLLLERFRHTGEVRVEEIEYFVVVETPFRETHYKSQILRPLEMSGDLHVVQGGTRTRRGVYPNGTVLRFPS